MTAVRVIISTLCQLALLQGPDLTRGQDFGYDGHMGPTHWGERYSECAGKHQSPINIDILNVKEVNLPPMEMVGFGDPIDNVHVTNNGHTVLIEVENEPHPRVRGGPLDDDYIFSQMHFHWGDNDTYGSEDKINYRSFAMELHMVFFKSEYGTARQAMSFPDGLTVLAFFYELDRHEHPAYNDITEALANVTDPHSSVQLQNPFSFLNILPYDLTRYFTYRGSLTTPPCSEVVVWLDFEQPIRLAHDQIEAFRELKSTHGKIKHNFRPVQPIGDRTVYYNSDRYFYYDSDNNVDNQPDTKTPAPRKRGRKGAASVNAPNSTAVALITALVFYLRSGVEP